MATLPLRLDDARVRWVPRRLAELLDLPLVDDAALLRRQERRHPAEVAVPAAALPIPRAVPAGVGLPEAATLPDGCAADRWRAALGLSGAHPMPVPGQFSDDEDPDQEEA